MAKTSKSTMHPSTSCYGSSKPHKSECWSPVSLINDAIKFTAAIYSNNTTNSQLTEESSSHQPKLVNPLFLRTNSLDSAVSPDSSDDEIVKQPPMATRKHLNDTFEIPGGLTVPVMENVFPNMTDYIPRCHNHTISSMTKRVGDNSTCSGNTGIKPSTPNFKIMSVVESYPSYMNVKMNQKHYRQGKNMDENVSYKDRDLMPKFNLSVCANLKANTSGERTANGFCSKRNKLPHATGLKSEIKHKRIGHGVEKQSFSPRHDDLSFMEWLSLRKHHPPPHHTNTGNENVANDSPKINGVDEEDGFDHDRGRVEVPSNPSYAQALKLGNSSPKASHKKISAVCHGKDREKKPPVVALDVSSEPKFGEMRVLHKNMRSTSSSSRYDQKDRLQYKKLFEERQAFLRDIKEKAPQNVNSCRNDEGNDVSEQCEKEDFYGEKVGANKYESGTDMIHFIIGVTNDDESWSDDDSDVDAVINEDLLGLFINPMNIPSCHLKSSSVGNDDKPDTDVCDHDVDTVNHVWNEYYGTEDGGDDNSDAGKAARKKVHFPPDNDGVTEVHVITDWYDEHQEARRGPWEELARDRARFRRRIDEAESIISPILSRFHRKNIIKTINSRGSTE